MTIARGFAGSITLCLLLHAGTLFAQEGAERTLSPYFFVEGAAPGVEAFPLEATEVTVNVNGVIADVLVKQTYKNEGAVPLNARYVFPASTRAAVHGLQMQVGDKKVVAKIKERQQAAREFQEAKRAGKTASLLESQRPNVFTMSVANIMPQDRVEVELRYSELLVPTDGVYELVYPTVVGPRYAGTPAAQAPAEDQWVKSPYLRAGKAPPSMFSLTANLSTGVPLADVRCTSHEVDVAWHDQSRARVTFTEKGSFGGDRDFILAYRLAGAQIQSGLLTYEGASENFFLLMVQPPAVVRPADIPAREYIFVLDVSGSMHGFPLDTAKTVMADLIANLRPTDTFNVLLFSGGSHLFAPESVAATDENVQRAIANIERQGGGGGTELEAALRRVVGLPRARKVSRTVVVVTDGYISEEKGAFRLIDDNLAHTNFFAFGIGSSVNRYLIEGIARAGQGEAFVVTSPAEASAAALRFRRYIESPVLTRIAVRYDGFEAYGVEPPVQPDLFAERPVVLFGKWRGPRKGTITVSGLTANGTFERTFDAAQVPSRPEHSALTQLWARTRIARLSDLNFELDDAEAVREVTSLGLTYSLLTKYTSFIAVLEEVRNRGGQAQDVEQPLPLPAGVSELAVGGGYASGAEPELWLLMVLGAFIVAVLGRRRLAGARERA